MKGKVTCSCGHSWSKSKSSKEDMNVCHICGKDNTMKDGGWLDKYQEGGNVVKTDATRVNKQMVPLNAKKVTQKQLDQREAQVRRNRINKANVAKDKMYTNPEEPIFGFSPEVFAESTSAIGDKLRVSDSPNIFDDYINLMPFFGEMASGLGKIPLNIKQGNYGQAAMNLATPLLAGAGEESLEGLVRELGKTKIANSANNVASAQDYFRRLYNPDDLFQRSILQDATENRLQDVVRPRQRLVPNDKSVEPSSFYNNNPDPNIDYTFTPSDAEIINHNNHLAKLDRIIDRAIEKSSNVDYNLGTSVMGMPIPSNLNTLRNWDNYNANSFKSADYTNFLQQWREQNGLVNKKTLLGKLKDKAGKVINTADEKLGKLVSPPKSLPEGVTLEKLSDEINKELVKGVGVKKRNDQLRVRLSGDLDNMFANTQIIDPSTNELVDAGFIKLTRQQQPYGSKKLSEVLFPNKKPSPYPGQDEWNNTLGFAKQGDFPFTKLSAQDKTILEKQGVSGEYNKAINEVLKRNNLGNVLSGGTGHTPKGGERWQNLIQKGLAEDLGGSYYKLKKNGGWLEKYNDGGPIQPNYNDASASAGPGFQGDGYSNVGRNYSPAWGGQFQMGGSIGGATQGIPGATGFMYSRDSGSNPSEDKGRNKVYKTDASAQNGKEMKFYQEGLDFKPKSISKNGSVIKDDMGQYNHPGEITEIGSNQITMQGVDYPVLGISDTGDTQMMYPNEEYQYDGDSVTEYPMMQNGGWLDSLVDAGKSAVNYIGGLFEDPAPVVKKAVAPSAKSKSDVYDTMLDLGFNNPKEKKLKQQLGKVDEYDVPVYDTKGYNVDKNRIKLETGRFKGANVSSRLIDDIAAAAKRNNIPVGQLLTLAGRESTFGEQKGKGKVSTKDMYTSGWNVAEDYKTYDPHRFLADKKVPGVNVIKTPEGYQYEVADEKAVREYLKKNPKLMEQYKKKVAETPDIGNRNFFDLSAEFLKKKGIQGYNPRDPKYVEMFNQDYDTLKQDKGLMSYLKKKGYKYEQGGQLTKLDQLTNFTNYNTKQPGGWLDKYQ